MQGAGLTLSCWAGWLLSSFDFDCVPYSYACSQSLTKPFYGCLKRAAVLFVFRGICAVCRLRIHLSPWFQSFSWILRGPTVCFYALALAGQTLVWCVTVSPRRLFSSAGRCCPHFLRRLKMRITQCLFALIWLLGSFQASEAWASVSILTEFQVVSISFPKLFSQQRLLQGKKCLHLRPCARTS